MSGATTADVDLARHIAETQQLRVEPFDHAPGDAAMTGMRGVKLDADTRFGSGIVFSRHYPTVFVADNGDIDMDELRIPGRDAEQWFRAVADAIAARRAEVTS